MIFHIITIFPDLVQAIFDYGVLRRGVDSGLIGHRIHDLRDHAKDRHRSVDDQPFGGGPGMVLLCEPVFEAVEDVRRECGAHLPLIYLSPAGERLTHPIACELAEGGDFIILCGRYEGLDQRVIDHLVDRELSIGDYVLSGGEAAAMVLVDAVARQIPGLVGNKSSVPAESFATGLLDWPHYTRPENFRGLAVPDVLLSGHHERIRQWREDQSLLLTYRRRPDLLTDEQVTRAEQILEKDRHEP